MKPSDGFSVRLAVPVCSFRKGYAREYLETEEVPPPSTVYGFLLSLVGEDDRRAYIGTRLAYAILSEPELSTVLRTVWRVKDRNSPLGVGTNRRPDFQEILTGLDMFIYVDMGPLAEELQGAAKNPSCVVRYGGLSLGESRDLINDAIWNPDQESSTAPCRWLTPDLEGDLPLPLWVDHVGSKGTFFGQFRLVPGTTSFPESDSPFWIAISPPDTIDQYSKTRTSRGVGSKT